LMEDVHKITRFILLANYEHNIIPELKSRCQIIELTPAPGNEIMTLCERVLKSERVKYKKSTLVNIIKKCHPDIRKTIFALQENTNEDNALTSDIVSRSEVIFENIMKSILAKNPESVRNLLKNNVIDYIGLYDHIFDNVGEFKSPADAILHVGEHLYRDSSVAIKEVNFIHMVVSMLQQGVI
jgi:DNA polymerase III delta prime subunit